MRAREELRETENGRGTVRVRAGGREGRRERIGVAGGRCGCEECLAWVAKVHMNVDVDLPGFVQSKFLLNAFSNSRNCSLFHS